MSHPAHKPTGTSAARIGRCDAAFQVTARSGPLSTPERLLDALRREILPALSDVLESDPMQSLNLHLDRLEIDIGHWPDEPNWDDLRYVLATKLRVALSDQLAPRASTDLRLVDTTAGPASTALQTRLVAFLTETGPVSAMELATHLRHHLRDHPEDTAALANQFSSEAQSHPVLAALSQSERTQVHSILADPSGSGPHMAAHDRKRLYRLLDRIAPVDRQDVLSLLRAAYRDWPELLQRATAPVHHWGRGQTDTGAPVPVRDVASGMSLEPPASPNGDASGEETLAQRKIPRRTSQIEVDRDPQATTAPATGSVDPMPRSSQKANPADSASNQPHGEQMGIASLIQVPDHAPAGQDLTPRKDLTSFPPPSDAAAMGPLRRLLAAPVQPDDPQARALQHRISVFQKSTDNVLHRAGHTRAQADAEAVNLASRLLLHPAFAPRILAANEDANPPMSTPKGPAPLPSQIDADGARWSDLGLPVSDDPLAILSASPHQDKARLEQHLTQLPPTAALIDLLLQTEARDQPTLVSTPLDRSLLARHLLYHWSRDRAALLAVLHSLPLNRLLSVTLSLVPPTAMLLQQNIRALVEAPTGAHGSIFLILSDLLEGRALDFDRARALGNSQQPRPDPDTVTRDRATSGKAASSDPHKAVEAQTDERHSTLAPPKFWTKAPLSARHFPAITQLMQAIGFSLGEIAFLTGATLAVAPDRDDAKNSRSLNQKSATGAQQDDLARAAPDYRHKTTTTSSDHTALPSGLNATPPASKYAPSLPDSGPIPPLPAHDTAPEASSDDRVPPSPKNRRESSVDRTGAEATSAQDRLVALLDAGLPGSAELFRDSLALLVKVWPEPLNGADAFAGTISQRSSALLLNLLVRPDRPGTLAAFLTEAVTLLEPDPAARPQILRVVAARLTYPNPSRDQNIRQMTHAALEAVIEFDQAETAIAPDAARKAKAAAPKPESRIIVTENAGIVLLHPFLKLLFERLDIVNGSRTIASTQLPRALRALQVLNSTAPTPRLDPLHLVLLGLSQGQDLDPAPEEEATTALIDGLLRSVIAQWGRLGKTSPDGLRETFLRRPGTLEFDDTGTHLRVTPGPFDMLLDALPWSLSPIALPWMPSPCHVIWRGEND